jgi:hypothetical protein
MLGIFWLVIKHNHGKGEFSEEEIEVVAGAGIEPAIRFRPFQSDRHIDFTRCCILTNFPVCLTLCLTYGIRLETS